MDNRQVRVWCVFRTLIVDPARPFPLLGGLAQAATDGVAVNVLSGGKQAVNSNKVAIITTTFLPEAKDLPAWTLSDSQLAKKRVADLNEVLLHFVGERPLDGVQQILNSSLRPLWEHKQVDMLRHVHECHEGKTVVLACPVNAVRKEPFEMVARKKRTSLKARESQLMCVARFIVVPDPFVMSGGNRHEIFIQHIRDMCK